MPYDTLETAQERILELEEELEKVNAERITLSENNSSLTTECETLRTLNQKYFNKLMAQDNTGKTNEEEEPEIMSCEEFAKTINL